MKSKNVVDENASAFENVNRLLVSIDDALFDANSTICEMEAYRGGKDDWGDVGTLNSILADVRELCWKIDNYAAIRLPNRNAGMSFVDDPDDYKKEQETRT